ncbi:hypothetical protein EV383_5768 [Pseudonocardia sediminis]|uniref:Copper(I)-binding protein n=1 Tax=Pseudonocardia sediminis TaxID=1397368 RepID=A0A4Q7V7S4_PSEST|nr:hypothetical protein [Pseudonocardia sediminis]RZT88819.1 hypothetical protein EV383_5768 [Pseudonocardia sediminis]
MSRTRRFRPSRTLTGAAGAVALTGVLALTGCGAGQLAQTANQISAVNGISSQVGQVVIRDARVAYPPRGAEGNVYPAGSAAPLEVTLLNTASVSDRLVGISSPVAPAVRVAGDPTLPQNIPLVAQVAAEGGVQPGNRPITIELGGLTAPIRPGLPTPVTFSFERAGSVTLQVPIAAPPEGTEPERADAEAEGSEQASPEPAAPAEAGAPAGGEAIVPAPQPAEAPGAPAPAPAEGGN